MVGYKFILLLLVSRVSIPVVVRLFDINRFRIPISNLIGNEMVEDHRE